MREGRAKGAGEPGEARLDPREERRLLLLAALGFSLVALVLFASFLLPGSTKIPSNPIGDGTRYFIFQRGFYAEQILQGNIPLWNPHIFSGLPFVGVFQSAVFYPLNVIYLVLPVGKALTVDFALHLILLGLGTFAWLRHWRIHPAGAFFGALMIMLGAPNFLRILAGQLSVLNTLAWRRCCYSRSTSSPRGGRSDGAWPVCSRRP